MRPAVINAVCSLLEKVVKGLVRDFGEIGNLQSARDGTETFVDIAIKRTEALIHDALHRLYPTANLWMPVSGMIDYGGSGAPLWIVSALDGQRNFSHGLPHFSLSLALKEGQQLMAAVVYDPLRYETFWAYRGGGAFLNQTRLRVSGRTQASQMLMASSIPQPDQAMRMASMVQALAMHGICVQSWGVSSLDLAYVASGRYDGFFGFNLSPHVVAAGALLIKEAGGIITTPELTFPSLQGDTIIAGNATSHGLLKLRFSDQKSSNSDSSVSAS